MSAKKIVKKHALLAALACFLPAAHAAGPQVPAVSIADQLGWVSNKSNNCGGYYIDQPFTYPVHLDDDDKIEILGDEALFSQRGTSILESKVSINRRDQQLTANKGLLYRDPVTGKFSAMEMIGNVHLREPNTLIIAKEGRYTLATQEKIFQDIRYRTALKNGHQIAGPHVSQEEAERERRVTQLTAWGEAHTFSQKESKIYEFTGASFSTCPPVRPAWNVKASHIVLNKNTGRGYATNARILVKNIPVFYTPYINFPIDSRRKSGFLWPTFGIGSNQWGPYFLTPFYWDMAPNYDMTITPGFLSKRGVQISDNFRYLTSTSNGHLYLSVLPHDRDFIDFKKAAQEQYQNSPDATIAAELTHLENASSTRKGLYWTDNAIYNPHWSSHVDFSYAGDDYYMKDFSSNLNETTQNQLLQEGDLYYKSQNWNFIGRIQVYQTLHPISESELPVENQYRRLPQLILNADYPDQAGGLDLFINNEVTHFNILNMPGAAATQPVGNRLNTQPGIALPITKSFFNLTPRFQLALTEYNLHQTADTDTPTTIKRAVPIFDIASGFSLNRDTTLFHHVFQQTLEPQVYYTYIPYRGQSNIPVFDTTVNTLTYDQLFSYNRFSGIDRIGDANQIGAGITTRFIDSQSGFEKVRLSIGEIMYFANRRVTLCNDDSCSDNPSNHSNDQRFSPISGLLDYHISSIWDAIAIGIWNPVTKQIDNTTLGLHYEPDDQHIVNLGYSFARNGDVQSGIVVNTARNNLKVSDLSLVWPLLQDISVVGRWSQAWNTNHLQNLILGLQYDTCCWAVRLVGARVFTGLNPDNKNTLQYNNQAFVQFSLKGLGDIGSGNPNVLLNSINGYHTQFGQDF